MICHAWTIPFHAVGFPQSTFGSATPLLYLGAVALLGRAFQTVTSPDRFRLKREGLWRRCWRGRLVLTPYLAGSSMTSTSKVASAVELRQINTRKTGALFVAGVDAAACVAKVDGPRVEQLRSLRRLSVALTKCLTT